MYICIYLYVCIYVFININNTILNGTPLHYFDNPKVKSNLNDYMRILLLQ